ncbi:MAG TPA: DNA-directed RNA polymerase subunit omega [Acholeplasma sp.]|jgi:DNA-directed RNA polymerase subunit omega
MNKNREGLRYPSIDQLLEKIDSKYKLVYAASKVAHIIHEEKLVIKDAKSVTPVGQALEEIIKGRVDITFEE